MSKVTNVTLLSNTSDENNLPKFPSLTGISGIEVFHADQRIKLTKYDFNEHQKKFHVHLFNQVHSFDAREQAEKFLSEYSIKFNSCYFYINQAYAEIIRIIQSNYFRISKKQMREFKTLQAAIDTILSRFTFYDSGSNDIYYKNLIFITEKLYTIINIFAGGEDLSNKLEPVKQALEALILWDRSIKGDKLIKESYELYKPVIEIKPRLRARRYRKAKRTGQPKEEIKNSPKVKKVQREDPLIDDFLSYFEKIKGRSKNTIISYRTSLFRFKDFMDAIGVSIFEARTKNIQMFLREQAGKDVSGKTINSCRYAISSFYKYCGKKGLVKTNPTKIIPKAKEAKKIPVFLNPELVNEVLDKIPLNNKFDVRDKTALEILYGCGLRVSELITLKIRNIDFLKNEIKVVGKGNKERIVPLTNHALNSIRDLLNEWEYKTEFLIETDGGGICYPMQIYRMVMYYFKTYPHVLRHTFATALMAGGCKDIMAIKDLLGHSSIAATQVYTHIETKRLKDIYDGTHPKS